MQIEEVRVRLNLDVTVASDSLPAPAPIESFADMVVNFIDKKRSIFLLFSL